MIITEFQEENNKELILNLIPTKMYKGTAPKKFGHKIRYRVLSSDYMYNILEYLKGKS